ncbi:MAG: hypothetical protein WKF75_09390, partial [Singulisphaera sp.]
FPDDQHGLIVVRDDTTGGVKETYELYGVHKPTAEGPWTVSRLAWKYSGSSTFSDRMEGMPTTTAGSTRMMPALVTYDDVFTRGVIDHCLRMTMISMGGLHVAPARFQAGGDLTRIPEGARIRLKASRVISGFSAGAQVILQALKTYGAILDDNGPNFQIQGTKDARWTPYQFDVELHAITAADFEVLDFDPGYTLTPPASLNGLAGVASGTFTVALAEPTANVGVGHALAGSYVGGFALQDYFVGGWVPAGGGWTVDGSTGGYRVTLTTAAQSSSFTYTPAAGLADGTAIKLHFYDNTLSRVAPDVVYTVGATGPLTAGSVSIATAAASRRSA